MALNLGGNVVQGGSTLYLSGGEAGTPQGWSQNVRGGGYNGIGRQSSMSSIYNAFEDYEKVNRQRKYLAAEYEDKIESLQKSLKQIEESNKTLVSECERLDVAAHAYEAIYEKNLKEKALYAAEIENEYRLLSKEMDLVEEEVNTKKSQLQQVEVIHRENLDLIVKTEEEYLSEYKKNPDIARVVNFKQTCDKLESDVQHKTAELNEQFQESANMKDRLSEEWTTYVKKCVKIAGVHVELKNKMKQRNALRSEVEFAVAANSGIRRPATLASISPSGIGKRNSLSSRLIGITTVPKKSRSSTFLEMDVIFGDSIRGVTYERRSLDRNSPFSGFRESSRLGSSLVSELKSRLKDTVRVTPMRRYSEVTSDRASTQSCVKTVVVAPSRNKDIDNQPSCNRFPQLQSEDTVGKRQPEAPNLLPEADISAGNKENQNAFEFIPPTPHNTIDNRHLELNKPAANNTIVPSNVMTTIPQTTQSTANPLAGFNFNLQSPPGNQPTFNLFGENFNLETSPPATQGGLDFFGGLFGPGPTTQQASGSSSFFTF